MKSVLIFVAVLAIGIAAYLALAQRDTPPAAPSVEIKSNDTTKNLAFIDTTLKDQGVPAPGKPEFDVHVQLAKTGQQNRFTFKIREKHGWAANGVYISFWHRSKDPQTGEWVKDSRETEMLCNRSSLRFGETLEHSAVVAVFEYPELKDFGTSEDWAARVSNFSELTAPK